MEKTSAYILKTDFLKDFELWDSLLPFLSEKRRTSILSCKRPEDQICSLGAGLLLCYALKEAGQKRPFPQILFHSYGKPYFKDNPFYFNLSHSNSEVMCLLSSSEIGCDIESVSDPVYAIAKKRFCKEEANYLDSISDEKEKARSFYRFWTIKESTLKTLGRGLSLPLNSFCIDFSSPELLVHTEEEQKLLYYKEYHLSKDFCCACAAYRPEDLPSFIHMLDHLTLEDLL